MAQKEFPSFVSISPNEKYSLYKIKKDKKFILQIKSLSNGQANDIDISNFSQLSLTWHPKGKLIFFQEFDPILKKYKLYKLDIHTKIRECIDIPASKNAIPPLRWSRKGTNLAYSATEDFLTRLYIYEFEKKNLIEINDTISPYSDFNWISDSLLVFVTNHNNSKLKKYDHELRETQDLNIPFKGDIKNISVNQSNIIFVGRRPLDEYYQVFKFSVKNKSLKKITNFLENASSCYLNNEGVEYLWNVNRGGVSHILSSNKTLNEHFNSMRRKYKSLEIELIGNKNVYIRAENFDKPPVVLRLNKNTFTEEIIHSSKWNNNLIIPKPIILDIPSIKNEYNVPVILWEVKNASITYIYIHGGPYLHISPKWNIMQTIFSNLSSNFMVVNYSGSSGYSKRYANRFDIESQVGDVLSAINYIASKNKTTEIVLLGSSFGGKIALNAFKKAKNIKGVVLISGFFDNSDIDLNKLKNASLIGFYGDFDPLTQKAQQLFNNLKSEGKNENYLTIYREEGHLFHKLESWEDLYFRINDVFGMQ